MIKKAFEDETIEYIEWMTSEGNEASNKIARKLDGKIIGKEPIIPTGVMEHWEEEIPCYVVYGIYRK